MSVQCEITARKSAGAEMGFFERYLTLWVALCIIAGIGLGHLIPQVFQSVGRMEIAKINLPVALNDVIMVFAFAPIVALLLGISSIIVPWDTFGP